MFRKAIISAENNLIARKARETADENGVDCFPASIIEIGTLRKDRRVPDLDAIRDKFPRDENGLGERRKFLTASVIASELVGVPIKRVLLRSDVIGLVDIPEEIKDKVVVISQDTIIKRPAILYFASPTGTGAHIESAISSLSKPRIDKQLKKGKWIGMVVEFK